MTSLPDSGNREYVATGGMREPATGKGRYDLLSPAVLKRVAQHYENGAEKYAARIGRKAYQIPDALIQQCVTCIHGLKEISQKIIWQQQYGIYQHLYSMKRTSLRMASYMT